MSGMYERAKLRGAILLARPIAPTLGGPQLSRIAETGKLTPREAMFFRAYIKGSKIGDAYLACLPEEHPQMNDDNARKAGWRMLRRIKQKVDWPRLMESAGLGVMRVLQEEEKRLGAMKSEFYEGEEVAVVEDNGTRMRATELLADLNRLRSKLEISGPGGGPIPVQIIDDIPGQAGQPKP